MDEENKDTKQETAEKSSWLEKPMKFQKQKNILIGIIGLMIIICSVMGLLVFMQNAKYGDPCRYCLESYPTVQCIALTDAGYLVDMRDAFGVNNKLTAVGEYINLTNTDKYEPNATVEEIPFENE